MRSLSDIRRPYPHPTSSLLLEPSHQLHRRRRLLRKSERVPDVFDPAGDTDATDERRQGGRAARRQGRREQGTGNRKRFSVLLAALPPRRLAASPRFRLSDATLKNLADADTGGERVLGGFE